tara:strand:+ start:37 stop:231 length:195 start_codon:yes stop_codon:yes gene_type:complete
VVDERKREKRKEIERARKSKEEQERKRRQTREYKIFQLTSSGAGTSPKVCWCIRSKDGNTSETV